MTAPEFDQLKAGDLVWSPPYRASGSIVRKMPDYVNIDWDDGQEGTLLRDSWQMKRLELLPAGPGKG
jgi:hypothetical protein